MRCAHALDIASSPSLLMLLVLVASTFAQQPVALQVNPPCGVPGTAVAPPPCENFGRAVCELADYAGDGIPEFAVGADYADNGALINTGRVDIFDGQTGLHLLPITGICLFFGATIRAGDLNGDSILDMAVGNHGSCGQGGTVYVYSGQAIIDVLNGTIPSLPLPGVVRHATASSFGWSLDTIPDLNGDGADELLVGAHRSFNSSGLAVLVDGATITPTSTHTVMATFQHRKPGERFGFTVGAVPDLDGDQKWEVAVAARQAGTVPPGSGIDPRPTVRIFAPSKFLGTQGVTLSVPHVTIHQPTFGMFYCNSMTSLSLAGESYFVVGTSDLGNGRVEMFRCSDLANLVSVPVHTEFGPNPGDDLGFALASGDLNGDSQEDLIVGVRRDDTIATDAGAVWVINGAYINAPQNNPKFLCTIPGDIQGMNFGTSVAVHRHGSGPTVLTGAPVFGPPLPFQNPLGGLVRAYSVAPCPALRLLFSQPLGPGSVGINVLGGTAGAVHLTAISFDAANRTFPGLGWWFGLHIAPSNLIAQLSSGLPLFVGVLDLTGAAGFQLPAGTVTTPIEAWGVAIDGVNVSNIATRVFTP